MISSEQIRQDFETIAALDVVEALVRATDKPLFFLSDFDYTLCDAYLYNPSSKDHIPQIQSDIIAAANNHNVLIATSRRVDNIGVRTLWQSGLIQPEHPIIVENGGVLAVQKNGEIQGIDLIPEEDKQLLQHASKVIQEQIRLKSNDVQLVVKHGRTLLISRIQDKNGNYLLDEQAWLADEIRSVLPHQSLQVTNTRSSVIIHPESVNKKNAFLRYLDLAHIDRSSLYVIGMGDAENDKEIFETSDLRVGFSQMVSGIVDVVLPQGVKSTATFLNRLAKYNK